MSYLVIHKFLNTTGLRLNLRRGSPYNLSANRASTREKLLIRLSLELRYRFRDNWMRDTTGAPERLLSLLVLQTKKLEAFRVSILPLLSAALIILIITKQF